MDITLNEEHDLFVTNADLTLTDDTNYVKQSLTIRLQFILNDWFLNITEGLPYPTVIFEKGTNISTIYDLYKEEILETDGVKEVVSLDLTPLSDEKELRIDFTVRQDNNTLTSQTINLGV